MKKSGEITYLVFGFVVCVALAAFCGWVNAGREDGLLSAIWHFVTTGGRP